MVRVEAATNVQLVPVHGALPRLAGPEVLPNFGGVTCKVLEETRDQAVFCKQSREDGLKRQLLCCLDLATVVVGGSGGLGVALSS